MNPKERLSIFEMIESMTPPVNKVSQEVVKMELAKHAGTYRAVLTQNSGTFGYEMALLRLRSSRLNFNRAGWDYLRNIVEIKIYHDWQRNNRT